MYRDMDLEWRTLQALELRDKNKMLTNVETYGLPLGPVFIIITVKSAEI